VTEQLELGQVTDVYVRRALERLSTRRSGGATGPPGPAGQAGLVWRDEWDPTVAYHPGDAVEHNGSSWIAPADMPVGVEPGVIPTDPVLYTIRGVRVHASERIASSTYITRTIDASSDTTDVSGRKAVALLLDRTGSSAHVLTFRNDHATSNLSVGIWDTGGGFQTGWSVTLTPGTEGTITLPAETRDLIALAYFTTSDAGNFAAKVTNPGLLVPPLLIPPEWDLLAAKGDPGATTGDLTYTHTQGVASASWTVVHGLHKYVSVDVVDTGDSVVIPSVHYDSVDQVTLSFGSPTSGKAFVN